MKKIMTTFLVVSLLMLSAGSVVAVRQNPSAGNGLSHFDEVGFFEENSEDVSFTKYHGKGIYSTTHVVRKNYVKPDKTGKPDKSDGPAFYKLMGVEWFDTPDYAVEDVLPFDVITASIAEWDDETSFDLLGIRSDDIGLGFDAVMDETNSFTMGDYPVSGVIAVCRTWYNSYTNEIVEYDILFDEDFAWGDVDEDGKMVMDYQNIATHEIGHAFGLSDLYMRPASKHTMYGYSSVGDVQKRDLASGDIAGIQAIYGL